MKYKSKFKRLKAQGGILNEDPQFFMPTNDQQNFNWMNLAQPSPVNPSGVTPGPRVTSEGTPVKDTGKVVPLERDAAGNLYNVNEERVKVGTGRFTENPYVKGFNYAASTITGIANMIQNNKLKDKEYKTLVHSLEPAYFENMEGEGLNNLPMYTQYGGGPAGFGPNLEHPGIAHEAFYGDMSIPSGANSYKYGGCKRKYQAGGLSSEKAKKMLKEGIVNGKPLTDAQKRYFGWIAGGRKQGGGNGQDQIAQIIQLFAQLQGEDPRDIMAQLQQMQPEEQQQAIAQMAEAIQAEQQGGQQMQTGGVIFPSAPATTTASGYTPQESYYRSSATLSHYKDLLNDKLKEKNPKAFQDYFKGLVDLRRAGKQPDALKYVQETPYEEYLSPEEVQSTLGADDYQKYLQSLQEVNQYNVVQGKQPLYGDVEGQNDVTKLNYGRRFASLQLTPTVAASNTEGTKRYNRSYKYNPETGNVEFTEEGDLSMRPSYITDIPGIKKYGGRVKQVGGVIPQIDPAVVFKNKFMQLGNQHNQAYAAYTNAIDNNLAQDELSKAAQILQNARGQIIQTGLEAQKQGFVFEGGSSNPNAYMKDELYTQFPNLVRKQTGGIKKYHKGGRHSYKMYDGYHRMPDGTIMSNDEMPNVYGLPDGMEQYADVEAEAGEVIQNQNGGYAKVADNANTHEQGGEMIPNVKRVLEDTSDKRKDKGSKALKVKPAVMEEAFGIKIKGDTTHARAFETAKKELDKSNKQYSTAKKDANLRTNLDKTGMNTLRLNEQFQSELPTEDDIFELLFLHQEGVKASNGINDDGSMAKYGKSKKQKNIYQTGGLKGKQNVSKKLKTPKGNINQVTYPGGLSALVDKWKDLIPGIENVTDPAKFQQMTYDYLLKNQPELIDQTIWGEGLNREGINLLKSGKNKAFNEAVGRAFDPKTFAVKPGYTFTQADREALGAAYPDSYLMNRLVVPDVTTSTTPDEQAPASPVTPGASFNPGVNVNPRFIRQPENRFHEPTYWSDIAAPMAGLVDSFRRSPELYNPVEFHQLRYKLLDPTAALTANQADFNAAVQGSNEMGTGAGQSNVANMLGQKYRANNQILSQYENQNAGIKNQEITYNTQVRDKQSVADAQSRGEFYKNVLLGREAQRQQFLTSLGQLSRVDQLKRRQNVSGNLMLKLSPAFDQFGEYNDYQYAPYLDPSMVNYNDNQPIKMTSKGKTRKTTTWKDAAGTVHKTTTSD